MATTLIEETLATTGRTIDEERARWRRAVDEAELGTYSASQWISDVVASWRNLAETLSTSQARWLGYQLTSIAPGVVAIAAPAGKDEVIEAFPIACAGAGGVELSADLSSPGAKGGRIPTENVELLVRGAGRILVVRLYGLKALGPATGDYQATVEAKGSKQPLVLLRVTVS